MKANAQRDETQGESEQEANIWAPQEWVYVIWVVMGNRLFSKIGYRTNPSPRFSQIIEGIPKRPFRIHMRKIDLDGKRPVVNDIGLISHMVD